VKSRGVVERANDRFVNAVDNEPGTRAKTKLLIPLARDALFAVPDASHDDLLRSALRNKGVHQSALLERARSKAFDLIGRGEVLPAVPAVSMRIRVR
jgi:hypothetical protein